MSFSKKSQCWFRGLVVGLVLVLFGCGSGGGGTGGGENWKYVAMGDSLAAGALASQGYVVRYRGYLEADNGVSVSLQNSAQIGWKSADLLNALRTDAGLRSAISSADVVTWDIGGNDLASAWDDYLSGSCGGADNQDCLRNAVANFEVNWDAIVSEIRSLNNGSKTILRTMDVYNPFVAEQLALGNFDQTEPYLDEVDAHIRNSGLQNGIPVAKVHEAFNGATGREDAIAKGLIAFDHFHPNDAGHKLMADLLRALGYGPKR